MEEIPPGERSKSREIEGSHIDFLQLVEAARGGCDSAMGQLLGECRPYLLAIANVELDDEINAKVGASDIVQNSILSAQRCIGDFHGGNRDELLAWLRGILIKDLQQAHRHYRAAKRHVGRETLLRDDSLSGQSIPLLDTGDSPSTAAVVREQQEHLYRAMNTLREDERRVIELRNWQRLSFAKIGEQMGRSAGAARKLWSRAIVRLKEILDGMDA